MIHGACGNGSQFELLAGEARIRGWSSKIINLRYHGVPTSAVDEKDLGNISILEYADYVQEQVEKIGPCFLVGHSMGGLIALKVAEMGGENIMGVILMGSVAPKGILFLSWPVLVRLPWYIKAFILKKTWKISPAHARALILNTTKPETANRIIKNLVHESGLAGRQCAFAQIPIDKSRIKTKILVIAGGLDRMAPLRVQIKIANLFRAEFTSIEGSDHTMHCNDHWKSCADVTLHWTESLARDFIARQRIISVPYRR